MPVGAVYLARLEGTDAFCRWNCECENGEHFFATMPIAHTRTMVPWTRECEMFRNRFCSLLLLFVCSPPVFALEELKVLFLGDHGHHQPRLRFGQLQPILATRGVRLDYTDNVRDINPEFLAKHDALVVYANIDRIEPDQEHALLDYVAQGGGLCPSIVPPIVFETQRKLWL